jgi:hypothetical protein
VDIYPNPATDNATISFEATESGKTTISLSNMLGQEVYTNSLGLMSSGKVTIPLQSMASGVYSVTLKCGNAVINKKLIKK